MRFRRHQEAAHARSTRLFVWFAVVVLALLLSANGLLAGAWWLASGHASHPRLFFETNTAVLLLFVLGGCVVETQRLRDGGGLRVAHWLGGVALAHGSKATERRLLNVVDEMALASGQPLPHVFLLPNEDAINALVAGWEADDMVLCVTQGALERLTRDELQGLIAHEFGHIRANDLPLTMRLLALVWGLSLVHGFGQHLMQADENGRINPLGWLVGLVLALVGWLGWLAGQGLQAAVARQREFLADAQAVQFTRSKDGIGQVLRKVWHDQRMLAGRMHHPAAKAVNALLLHAADGGHWLDAHPRLSERVRCVYGRVEPPLAAPLLKPPLDEPRRVMPDTPTSAPIAPTQPSVHPTSSQAALGLVPISMHSDDDLAAQAALQRLQHLTGPNEQRLAVLALMLDPGNARERKLWRQQAQAWPLADGILDDVLTLPANRRLPEFERLCLRLRQAPIAPRRQTVESARDLLRADGRVSPKDRLWWLALRHHLQPPVPLAAATRAAPPAPAPSTLPSDCHAAIGAVSAYLARVMPEPELGHSDPAQPPAHTLAATSRLWLHAVLNRLAIPMVAGQIPDTDQLMQALAQLQEIPWMQRPLLLKAWVEEAVNHSPKGLMTQDTADTLRLMACLLTLPLPPMLAAQYP